MSWLTRGGRGPGAVRPGVRASTSSHDDVVQRGAPGLAALMDVLHQDGRHSLLDLGIASDGHLRLLSRFGRRIRFAGIVPLTDVEDQARAMEAIEPNPERPYDVVLAWDVLDHLDPEQRTALLARLADITAPDARLYALVSSSGASTVRPVRSTIEEGGRVSMRPVGPPRPNSQPLLPAHMERLLEPFEITNAYTLRVGLREYVAMKR